LAKENFDELIFQPYLMGKKLPNAWFCELMLDFNPLSALFHVYSTLAAGTLGYASQMPSLFLLVVRGY